MRELKFRAWHKTEFEYFGLYTDKGEILDDWFNYDDIFEQYTGVNDKNGNEIYEGDIIQEDLSFNVDSIDGIFKYKVYWDEETLCWSLDPIGNESIHDDLWECNSSVAVIGNIHETPELLEN